MNKRYFGEGRGNRGEWWFFILGFFGGCGKEWGLVVVGGACSGCEMRL